MDHDFQPVANYQSNYFIFFEFHNVFSRCFLVVKTNVVLLGVRGLVHVARVHRLCVALIALRAR